MAKNKNHNIRFRIWLYAGDEKLLGIGRVELLEKIKETGSITSAAKLMKMSYRQAWQMVSEMNERSNQPLVEKHLGGKSGGGAIVTDAGINAIANFKKLERTISVFIKKESKKMKI
ncbi:winged helix-turn-helix domain-containing protein [soil metagenome]